MLLNTRMYQQQQKKNRNSVDACTAFIPINKNLNMYSKMKKKKNV